MGYNDDSVVKVDQEFFEPFNSRQVKVVGRLIQKKNVRITKQCLRQKNFDLLASCKVSHLGIMEIGFNSKTIQKSSSIRFCFPSVHLCKFAFQFTGTDTVFISEVRFCIDSIFFFHDLIQSLVTHDNSIQNCICIIFEVILLQERETLARSDNNVTVGRL